MRNKFEKLKNNINEKIDPLEGSVGLYVKFLESNQSYSINENHQFWAASVVKLPILAEFYKKVSEETLSLEAKIKVKKENIVKGSGIIHLLDVNNEWTLLDIAKLTIILSDNTATNELLDLVNAENVEESMNKLDLKNTTVRHKMFIPAGKGPNLTTPKDISLLLENIYEKELPYSEEMLNILNETKLRDRIPKYLPNDVRISHKTGSLPKGVHDVGIIFSKNPFIFSFLSDDQKSNVKTKQVCAEIAKMCYEFSIE